MLEKIKQLLTQYAVELLTLAIAFVVGIFIGVVLAMVADS